MAFILKSTKYGYNFLGLARQASLTYRQKKILLETSKYVKLNEVWARSAAALSAPKVQSNFFSIDKNVGHLQSNLKANMVDLHIVERTLDLIKKDPGSLTTSKLLVLLNCCGTAAFRNSEENRVAMAKKIWDFAKKNGIKFDVSHYNSLLNTYIENCHEFSLEDFLTDMRKAGVEPNVVTYRRLLKSACQHGNISDAGDLLEIMKKKNLTICEYDFCSLIQGHYEAGDLEEGKKIINVMKNRGIEPSQETYVYLLCGYAKHGKIQEMKALMEELKEMNVHMNDTYLLNIIYTLAINNHSEEIDSLLSKVDKCYDYEKNCIKIVHRLFHKQKDKEALKLFESLQKMGYSSEFIEKQALGLIEHFVFNRNPSEVIDICDKITEKGWTSIAYSHALKKAVLRMNLSYCTQLLHELREKNFPIRPNYFWPLIVRYSENGNRGVISVLKSMKLLSIVPCYGTVSTFLDMYYKFGANSEEDLIKLRRSGVRECHGSLIALWNSIKSGNIEDAEFIASTYGIFKPRGRTLSLLIKNFMELYPQDGQKVINIIYYLAHDYFIYNSIENEEANEEDEIPESAKGVDAFYDAAIKALIEQCSQDVLLHLLENAPKEKFMIPPNSAAKLRKITNSEVLLKEFDSSNFSLNEELLKKKSFNTLTISKFLDPNGVISLSKSNCAEAEKLWKELGPKVSADEHFAIIDMFSKHSQYDKAFDAIERLKELNNKLQSNPHYKIKFRTSLHNLRHSGDVKKMINSCKIGIEMDLIDDNYILPIIRTMLCSDDVPKAVEENYSYIEKVKFVKSVFEILNSLIKLGHEDLAEKVTRTLCETNSPDVVYTSLFTAYVANGNKSSSRKVLEKISFKFQMNIFLNWFSTEFSDLKMNFDEAMEIAKIMRPTDRTRLYAFVLSKYQREKNVIGLKGLFEHCQEDNTTDPFFLEHLHHCLKKVERDDGDTTHDSSENMRSVEWSMDRVKELLSSGNSTDKVLEKLNMRQLPANTALKVVFLLAAEGRTPEVILGINKYRFSRHIPEIATEFLKNKKVNEFIEFVNTFTSLKKLPVVYNCFASQEERIISIMKNDEEFFEKCATLAQRCYTQEKYDHLLVFFIKMCVHLPKKHAKVEELLSTNDSNITSRFRSYCLSSLLLSSAEDTDFCKNILENQKIKSVFSEGLEHFYERIIHFYNDNGDLNTAMSYLEKAKRDGVSEKLSKRLLSSLKSNMENEGSTFPYSALLEAA